MVENGSFSFCLIAVKFSAPEGQVADASSVAALVAKCVVQVWELRRQEA